MSGWDENRAAMTQREVLYLQGRAEQGRQALLTDALSPHQRKQPVVFSANRVSQFLGRSRASVLDWLKSHGVVKQSDRHEISQDDLTAMSKDMKLAAQRPPRCVVLAVANQKGGVSKTTTAVHLGSYCALKGMRTLLIDADSQASTTAYQGINPDIFIDEQDTISFILSDGGPGDTPPPSLRSLIRKAEHIKGLDFVPACLELGNSDIEVYRKTFAGAERFAFWDKLRIAVDAIRDDYDLIIIDVPPHISVATWNAVYAADALLVPLGARTLDFASTLRFIDWLNLFANRLPGVIFERIRFLVSNYDGQGSSQDDLRMIEATFGDYLLPVHAKHSTEIQRAATKLKTIYELPKPVGHRDAWSAACKGMDEVNQCILDAFADIWNQPLPRRLAANEEAAA